MLSRWNCSTIFFVINLFFFLILTSFFIWLCLGGRPFEVFGIALKNFFKADANLILLIKEPTDVFEKKCADSNCINSDNQKKIALLAKGEIVKVIEEVAKKDYRYFRVRLEQGRTGYVVISNTYEVVYTRDKP